MSVIEVKMFTVICDNCKKSADEGSEFAGWNDEDFAKDVATDSGYATEGDLHYCSNCCSYDDDDNLIIKVIDKNNESAK